MVITIDNKCVDPIEGCLKAAGTNNICLLAAGNDEEADKLAIANFKANQATYAATTLLTWLADGENRADMLQWIAEGAAKAGRDEVAWLDDTDNSQVALDWIAAQTQTQMQLANKEVSIASGSPIIERRLGSVSASWGNDAVSTQLLIGGALLVAAGVAIGAVKRLVIKRTAEVSSREDKSHYDPLIEE